MNNDPLDHSKVELDSWYTFLNEVIGSFCFTLAIASLSFGEHSEVAATISICFVLTLMSSLAFRRKVERHFKRLERYKGKRKATFYAMARSPIFLVGALCLALVALGYDLSDASGFSLASLYGLENT
ncbi:hypothetical protein [Vibrio proteolyticus]